VVTTYLTPAFCCSLSRVVRLFGASAFKNKTG
jgi:hypothetical protein